MKFSKLLALGLTSSLLLTGLTSCGKAKDTQASDNGATTVKLGVVGSIYEDLWQPAKEKLAEDNINLEIVFFSDYVTPNNALSNGEIDLNGFQHRIFLEGEIEDNGYQIQNIANTFIMPLHIFSDHIQSIGELKDGDIVAIPDDLTNGGRALKQLEHAGLIALDPEAAFSPTVADILSYTVKIEIKELKANLLPSTLPDVAAAVINGNYALDFGLVDANIIYHDANFNAEEYWNLIAARTEDLEDPIKKETYRRVVAAFQSDATENVFDNVYSGYFIKAGWDQDLLE